MVSPLQTALDAWLAAGDPTLEGPLTAELSRLTAAARGPEWREHNWDSYRWDQFQRESWYVTVPFAALAAGRSPVVPVTAAERLLALPDQPAEHPWERRQPGRAYRPYWRTDKRFLTLVAQIAARWPTDSVHLRRELLRLAAKLPPRDRDPVLLACVSLGLAEGQSGPLVRAVLDRARTDELGARGELVLAALRHSDGLAEAERDHLLSEATATARRTTAFIASNPFAACVEALAQNELGSAAELLELVERATRLKLLEWDGWQSALHAAGRATTRLARRLGAEVVYEVAEGLLRWARWFPGLQPWIFAAGARGVAGADQSDLVRRALQGARTIRPTGHTVRAEAISVALLVAAEAESAAAELQRSLERWARLGVGGDIGVGLLAAVLELAALGPPHYPAALNLARALPAGELRSLALAHLAGLPGAAPDLAAETALALRRWRWRPPPGLVVAPLWLAWSTDLGADHPAVTGLVQLACAARLGDLEGPDWAAALMALGPHVASPAALRPLAALAGEDLGWWRLPILALLADGCAERLAPASPLDAIATPC